MEIVDMMTIGDLAKTSLSKDDEKVFMDLYENLNHSASDTVRSAAQSTIDNMQKLLDESTDKEICDSVYVVICTDKYKNYR